MLLSMLRRVPSVQTDLKNIRRCGGGCRRSSLCCRVVSTCILNSFSELFKMSPWHSSQLFHSAVGFLFVHLSLDGRRRLVASYVRSCFQGVWLCSSHLRFAMAPYDKIVITPCTIVERDTWETSLVHCLSIVTRASHL